MCGSEENEPGTQLGAGVGWSWAVESGISGMDSDRIHSERDD